MYVETLAYLRSRRWAQLAALPLLALSVWLPAPRSHADSLGYCNPSSTAFDPADVPPDGSAPVSVPGVRQRKMRINGVTTRLLEAGRDSARAAVVFMHGSPGSGADWAGLMPKVARGGHRAVAFDMPGFGHAEPAWGGPYTLDAAVRFFQRALRRLRISRVHLVAHDIGGPVGLEWGSRHPRRLRSAVLFDTGLLLGYRHHNLAQISRTPDVGESFWLSMNRETWNRGIQDGQTKPLPPEFTNRLYDDLDRETRCAILGMYRAASEEEIHAFARRQADILARWRRRPALVIWGEDDPYLPAAMAKRQRRGFPRARIKVFKDSGHWPFVDYAARTRRLVVPFLHAALAR
jgi:pimeloyl-ACP methyl ester carboxylesterase